MARRSSMASPIASAPSCSGASASKICSRRKRRFPRPQPVRRGRRLSPLASRDRITGREVPMQRRWRVGLRASLAVFLIILATLAVARPAGAQGRLRGPYLDIVWDYRDGNHQEAIDAIAAWPIDGIRERVFKDFDTGVALAIGGGRRKASEAQRFAMVKIWAALTPVAALMHVEAGYQLLEKKQ